jgi:hypothetical protein
VQAPAADAKKAMMSMGLSQNVADGFEQMCAAFNDGRIAATITRDKESTTPTPLEEFAGLFAAVYGQ